MTLKRYLSYLTRGDIVLISGVLALLVFWLVWSALIWSAPSGGEVSVVVRGEEIFRAELSEQEQEVELEVEGLEFTLELQEKKVRIRPMPHEDCPRQICSSMGWISSPGQAIVCVPNQLLISVEGAETGDEKQPVDAIAY